jgi:hypothetical protein
MINGKSKHLFTAVLLLIYLLSANPLYVQFILRNGKPERVNAALPAAGPRQDFIYRLAHLRLVNYEREALYELRGFAFLRADPQRHNRVSVVLVSEDGNRVYPPVPLAVASMLKSFDYQRPVDEQAEFRVLIAKQTLPPGNYQIGLLLEEEGGTRQDFLLTGSTIEKTPNKVLYRAEIKDTDE